MATTAARPTKTSAPHKGLSIPRRFTTAGRDPFEGVEFTKIYSSVRNIDGSVISEMNDVEVPADWDQTAIDILVSKYFRKAGVPQVDQNGQTMLGDDGQPLLGSEKSAKQWAMRIANAWRIWGESAHYFATPADAEAYRDEMAYMLIHQMASPNSPQHFNTGLFEAYDIVADPEGNWYFDPETGTTKESTHRYERVAVNACFISRVEDELVGPHSIFDYIQNEARLFKSGSGSGANLSLIRGKGERLSGGGTSSGVMSFARVADRAAGAIKSGGTTRRAAKMVILDVDHPEIEDFIWCKVQEEKKVAALVAAGFSSDWNGEAYDTVSFQNGNNSVRIMPGFMQAVKDDGDWNLTARSTGLPTKTLKARNLWDQIADAAWQCADPGIQFDDLLNDWNTAANDERLRGSNPCSEYTHVDDTACNLASLNLVKYFDDNRQKFNIEDFTHAARLFTLTLEISVSMSHYPSERIAAKSFEHRTLGLGYANLGALLMRAGLPYDSPEGMAVMGAITALMHDTAYATSSELAEAAGACIAYGRNTEPMHKVIRNHARAAYGTRLEESSLGEYEDLTVTPVGVDHRLLGRTAFAALSDAVVSAADKMLEGTQNGVGFRNMQVTVLAPTGTIGLQMGCDTTGIEPDFALVKFKKLAGGGYMKIVNNSVRPALKALGYSDDAVQRILTHALGTQSLDGNTVVNRQSLLQRGLSEVGIERAETQLKAVTELQMAFGSYFVGIDVLEGMGIEESVYSAPEFSLLTHLGYTHNEIVSSSDVICGHQTVEGAADLRHEHLAVFDTANNCGDGTRFIAWQGHVRALGAVAAHLSGSASKTINMPNEATLQDVKDAYEMSYSLGVKCNAIYRDGSKLSQVLSSQKAKEEEEKEAEVMQDALAVVAAAVREIQPGESPSSYYHGTTPPKFRMPNMRYGPTWKLNIGGTELFLRAGEYEDGTLGEIYADMSKEGSILKSIVSAFCIAVSHALQFGVPLEKFVETFTFHNFAPNGPVQGHDALKFCTSILDAMFRVLAHHYLDRDDLVQVKGKTPQRIVRVNPGQPVVLTADTLALAAPPALAAIVPAQAPAPEHREEVTPLQHAAASTPGTTMAGQQVASGEACTTCGGQMVRSGTCSRCINCGETSGCS